MILQVRVEPIENAPDYAIVVSPDAKVITEAERNSAGRWYRGGMIVYPTHYLPDGFPALSDQAAPCERCGELAAEDDELTRFGFPVSTTPVPGFYGRIKELEAENERLRERLARLKGMPPLAQVERSALVLRNDAETTTSRTNEMSFRQTSQWLLDIVERIREAKAALPASPDPNRAAGVGGDGS